MKRLFRLLFKLGVLAAIGFGIAMAIKKLTATPEMAEMPLEPWPPLEPNPASSVDNGSAPETDVVVEEIIVEETVIEE